MPIIMHCNVDVFAVHTSQSTNVDEWNNYQASDVLALDRCNIASGNVAASWQEPWRYYVLALFMSAPANQQQHDISR